MEGRGSLHQDTWCEADLCAPFHLPAALAQTSYLPPSDFRPPYGEVSDTLYAALDNRGYKSQSLLPHILLRFDADSASRRGLPVV